MSVKSTNKKVLKACLETLSNERETIPHAEEGPKATTKEEYLKKLATKGLSISPLEASKSLLAKRGLDIEENGLKAAFTVFSLFDTEEKKDYGVAAFISGDMFSVKDYIKKCNTEECVVNGVAIPTVLDCLKPKFISGPFMETIIRSMPVATKELAKYFAANCKSGWLLYAPYRGEDHLRGTAAVDVGVQMYHYALAWQRALTGQPIHFEKVEVVNYFVDVDELEVIHKMFTTQDPHFGRRRGTITINR